MKTILAVVLAMGLCGCSTFDRLDEIDLPISEVDLFAAQLKAAMTIADIDGNDRVNGRTEVILFLLALTDIVVISDAEDGT